jgi:hypothetical protein
MERLCVLTVRNVGLGDVCADLSVLLMGLLVVVWSAAGLIGLMVCQHFRSWMSLALQLLRSHAGDEHVAASWDHRGTAPRVRRDVELERRRP